MDTYHIQFNRSLFQYAYTAINQFINDTSIKLSFADNVICYSPRPIKYGYKIEQGYFQGYELTFKKAVTNTYTIIRDTIVKAWNEWPRRSFKREIESCLKQLDDKYLCMAYIGESIKNPYYITIKFAEYNMPQVSKHGLYYVITDVERDDVQFMWNISCDFECLDMGYNITHLYEHLSVNPEIMSVDINAITYPTQNAMGILSNHEHIMPQLKYLDKLNDRDYWLSEEMKTNITREVARVANETYNDTDLTQGFHGLSYKVANFDPDILYRAHCNQVRNGLLIYNPNKVNLDDEIEFMKKIKQPIKLEIKRLEFTVIPPSIFDQKNIFELNVKNANYINCLINHDIYMEINKNAFIPILPYISVDVHDYNYVYSTLLVNDNIDVMKKLCDGSLE